MALLRAHSVIWLVVLTTRLGFAACGDDPGDQAAVAAARAAVDTACPCAAATSHAAYLSCARSTLRMQETLRPECGQALARCAAKSVCGRTGAVTCCRTRASGVTRCAIKGDATRCTAPAGGSACVGLHASCCDACVAGGCAPPPTTTTTTIGFTCVNGPFPECGGTCGPGEICEVAPFGDCQCFPDGSQPCGDSVGPVCNGTCPSGEHCGNLSFLGPCGCVADGTTACGETQSCGSGSCTAGGSCYAFILSGLSSPVCGCAPTGVACCDGGLACPSGQTCGMAPNLCSCF